MYRKNRIPFSGVTVPEADLKDPAIVNGENIVIAQTMLVCKGWLNQNEYVRLIELHKLGTEDFVSDECQAVHFIIGSLHAVGIENTPTNMAEILLTIPECFWPSMIPSDDRWSWLWTWLSARLDDHLLSPAWFDESLESVVREVAGFKARNKQAQAHIAKAKALIAGTKP